MRRIATCLGFLLVTASSAAAQPRPKGVEIEEVDISGAVEDLVVLHDGSGHYLVVEPYELTDHVYYGDGETFFRQRAYSGFSDRGNGRFSRSMWSPRVDHRAELALQDGDTWKMTCGERETPLVQLEAGKAAHMLGSATFRDVYWPRQGYALARDDRGIYYYVDRLRDPYGGKGFRLFVGPMGRLDQKNMVNIVSDSEGDIFASDSGTLRLILARDDATWIEGESRRQLTIVPPRRNLSLIYAGLRVYTGKLGVPCDDM